MLPRMTVNELASKTGYQMGSDHPRAKQFMREQAAGEQAKAGPPNYRDADPEGPSCGSCRDFTSNENGGRCFRFNVPVQDAMVCDAHTPAGEESMADPGMYTEDPAV